MRYEVDEVVSSQAKSPHELFMINLGAHLLLGPAGIFLDIGRWGFLLPLSVSAFFIGHAYRRAASSSRSGPWFVAMHWQLAVKRYRMLMIGYAVTIAFLVFSWLLSLGIDPASPQKFLPVALTRIGVMPTLVMVFVCFVLANSGLGMALRGELPDRFVSKKEIADLVPPVIE